VFFNEQARIIMSRTAGQPTYCQYTAVITMFIGLASETHCNIHWVGYPPNDIAVHCWSALGSAHTTELSKKRLIIMRTRACAIVS
jgi:hypothetical protein